MPLHRTDQAGFVPGASPGNTAAQNTAAIQAAIDAAAAAGGGVVALGFGTHLITGLTIKAKVTLRGLGPNATVLKLADAQNRDVVVGDGAYALFGTNSPAGITDWEISHLTLDGNRANQASGTPDAVNGLAFYGTTFRLHSLDIINALGHGIRSEWYTFGENVGGIEADARYLTIDRTNRHGWWFKGPHDINVDHLAIIDAGGEADNTWCGLYIEAGNGRWFNTHTWHRSATTNRMKFGISTAGSSEFVAGHFEGGRAQVEHRGAKASLVACRLYAHQGAAGSALVVISGDDNKHTSCIYDALDTDDFYAVTLGTGANVARNTFMGCQFNGFKLRTPLNFAFDGGNYFLGCRGNCGAGGATSFGGAAAAASHVDYRQTGTGINPTVPLGGTWTSSADVAVNGFVTVRDGGGTTRKLATIA